MTEEKKERYREQLSKTVLIGTKQQQKIADILVQMERDKDLTDDMRLELESHATQLTINTPQQEVQSSSSKDDRRFLPRYDFKEDYESICGLKEFGFDEKTNNVAKEYASWFRSEYLPNFLPMPDAAQQYPIATVFALLNCKCVLSKRQCIPIPYFIGSNGSGKTELGKTIAQHYPSHLQCEIRPGFTGASIRDLLDSKFGSGEGGYALVDNFNRNEWLSKWGAHYDILLANCEESAVSRLSNAGSETTKSEYKHYSYKVITSVFSLDEGSDPECGEVARRTILLNFQESKPSYSRIMYDWDGMQRVYQRIWGEEGMETLHKVYAPTLGKLNRIKPSNIPDAINPKKWIICQVPIAVGVYCGVFESIKHGIDTFAKHFTYLKGSKGTGVGSQLSIILGRWVKDELPKIGESNRKNRYASESSKQIDTHIPQESLIKHLQEKMGFQVGRRDMDELILQMSNYGYRYEAMGNGMGFVKASTLAS